MVSHAVVAKNRSPRGKHMQFHLPTGFRLIIAYVIFGPALVIVEATKDCSIKLVDC